MSEQAPTVTLHDEGKPDPVSPAKQIIKDALADVTVTDARGRKIVIRRPPVLGQYRLAEALGQAASNQVYYGMCVPLLYVGSIDGDANLPMNSKREIEALIQRLDHDGLEAVSEGIEKNFAPKDPDEAANSIKK